MKKIILFYLVLILTLTWIFSWAAAQEWDNGELPDWLKRVELSVEYQTDKKPKFYFQTVQPLYQDSDQIHTIFIQPRVNLQDERTTYNLGAGYRHLSSEDWIWGVNVFGDYQDQHRHGRLGFGLEALGQIWEARINTYWNGITEKRKIKITESGTSLEKVADGFDYELGVPLPYLPWLKIYGSGFFYNFREVKDRSGWKSRLEARLNDRLRLEFFTFDDNKGEQEFGGRVRMQIAFMNLRDILAALKFSEEPFPKKDLTQELLIPVERDFKITVEKYTKGGGLTVEAGRS